MATRKRAAPAVDVREAVLTPLASMRPHPANYNRHPEEQLRHLERSILEHGFYRNVILAEDGTILAGHGAVEAARRIGLREVPALTLPIHPDDPRALKVLAGDNQIAALAEVDESALAEILATIGEDDLLGTGFDDASFRELLESVGVEPDAFGEEDDIVDAGADDPPEDPVSQPGSIWQCGRHRVMCGDSTNAKQVAALLRDACPPLMVTDPPYGVNYDPDWRTRDLGTQVARPGKVSNDDRPDWREAYELFPGNVAYVWCPSLHVHTFAASIELAGFDLRSLLIWRKPRFAISRGHYHWQHEPCWYAVRQGATADWTGDRKQTTVWDIDGVAAFGREPEEDRTPHGTQKPLECMARPMRNHGRPGDGVYDPFLGSGTTLIAAEKLGRTCFGMELDPRYVDVILQRFERTTGEQAINVGSGQPFSAHTPG